MRARTSWVVLAAGVLTVAALSIAAGMSLGSGIRIAGIAAGAALGVFALGSLVLLALRRRSVTTQVTAVALITVAAFGAGSIAAAKAMFLSGHDLQTLFVILAAAGTVGLLASMTLGRRVTVASRSLGEATRRIGEGELLTNLERPSPAEFSRLADELESMSLRLDEANRKGQALEASRRELVAWVSHDLRTPLAGIRAMAEALEDGVVADPATVSSYYANLREETDRLTELVDDLFELSVIQAGALNLHMERASLSDLVSDAIATASVFARAKGVRLQGRMDGGAPPLRLSTLEMTRVLRNLLQNAIRHTPSDGTVWVETGVEEERAYVAVADQCGGIPEQDVDRVFDLAFRGEAARTPNSGELGGLGLAIVRGIVEAHHGQVSVRNEAQGCRFVVHLPMSGATS
jgi:signal transduction histidine kinase